MEFRLYKISGYEEAINSLRMSHGKYFSIPKADEVQDLVYVCTNRKGFLATEREYRNKIEEVTFRNLGKSRFHNKVTGDYKTDIAEFKRLLGIVMDQAMGENDHHTLMKYIDISFFTVGLHRGAQDDLDAHAIGFNNRITRYSTRLAVISEPKLSEWYQDKMIPFHDVIQQRQGIEGYVEDPNLPKSVFVGNDEFVYTPFGYVLKNYADMAENNGLRKDVMRGGMNIGMASDALWKSDIFNLRYIYFRRSKLTKANPELRIGMESLADQIEKHLPVLGEKFRYEFTDTKQWEHLNKIRKVASDEFKLLNGLNAIKEKEMTLDDLLQEGIRLGVVEDVLGQVDMSLHKAFDVIQAVGAKALATGPKKKEEESEDSAG